MASLSPINTSTPDDGLGDPIRDAFNKTNANDTAINAQVEAISAAFGIPALQVDMGVSGGTLLSDNGAVKAWFDELEAAISGNKVLSAGYTAAAQPYSYPAPTDTNETAISKLHSYVLNLDQGLTLAGAFDGTTIPTTGTAADGTIKAGDMYLANGTGAFTTDLGLHEVTPKDTIIALVDGPAAPADWLYQSNKDDTDYVASADGMTLSIDGKYVHQDSHTLNLPALTAAIDGKEISLASAQADWNATAASGGVWAPAGADTLNWGAVPLAGGADVVTLIAQFGSTSWLVAVGGATAPELDQSYNTEAELPPTGGGAVPVGRRSNVTNDPGKNGVYIATGPVGGAATGWERS